MVTALSDYKVIIVGAGFFGSTLAHIIASELSLPVLIIDSRNHIGGSAYSYRDVETNIEVHKYGAHIFHTPNQKIWEFANKFTSFNNYVHRVYSRHNNQLYSLPINLHTISQFFGKALSPKEAKSLLPSSSNNWNNFEDKAIGLVGKELYEAFFKNYSIKQWGEDPKNLPAHLMSRLPIRFNTNADYFDHKHQGIPLTGYTKMFDNMLNNNLITVKLNTNYSEIRNQIIPSQIVVYTGTIDGYFNYKLGRLGWRTIDFNIKTVPVDDYQGTSVVNYPDLTVPFTRIIEFKHFVPHNNYTQGKSIISCEYSRSAINDDNPYYPTNTLNDCKIYEKYTELAQQESVIFGGRLGTYTYLDMHQAIGAAMNTYENKIKLVLGRSN